MTASLHRYDGLFFPGTGGSEEIGAAGGKYYSINVPLQENIDDASYFDVFKHVMSGIMESFRPSVVVLQCGADSLASDRLGCFNLSIRGHGACVEYMKSFKVPMLVLGGGGYTIRNVSRCWAYETSVLVDVDIQNQLPITDYRSHYAPDYNLHPDIVDPNLENMNTRAYLEGIKEKITEYLRFLNGAPSVAMQEIPPDLQGFVGGDVDVEVDANEDERGEGRWDGPNDGIGEGAVKRKREKEGKGIDGREFYEGDRDHDH